MRFVMPETHSPRAIGLGAGPGGARRRSAGRAVSRGAPGSQHWGLTSLTSTPRLSPPTGRTAPQYAISPRCAAMSFPLRLRSACLRACISYGPVVHPSAAAGVRGDSVRPPVGVRPRLCRGRLEGVNGQLAWSGVSSPSRHACRGSFSAVVAPVGWVLGCRWTSRQEVSGGSGRRQGRSCRRLLFSRQVSRVALPASPAEAHPVLPGGFQRHGAAVLAAPRHRRRS